MSEESARLEALLQAVPIFAALERVELARLVGALEETDLAAHEVIFKEGGESDGLYIVQSGQVHLTVRAPDGERLIREVGAGMHFGEVGMLLDRCTASATAHTAVKLWKVPRERFDELVHESPAFVLALAGSMAARYDDGLRSSVGASASAPAAAWKARPPRREPTAPGESLHRTLVALAIAAAIPLFAWWAPPPGGLTPQGWRVILIILSAAVGWLLEPVPDFVTTLLMAAAWGAAGLAPLSSIFDGFVSSSWILGLGALTLAAAMVRSGLMFRASLAVLRWFPASPAGQIIALLVGGLLITPLVPLAVGRVAAIAPFTRELARGMGYRDGSRGGASLAIAGVLGYAAFSSIFLTGLAMNFFVLELFPESERLEATWLVWLTRAAPTGLVFLVGSALALLVWFRPGVGGASRRVRDQEHVLGPLTSRELVTIGALATMIVGFLALPLLHVNPAWFAVGALALAIGGGGLSRDLFRRAIDWGFLIQFGILLGAGGVLHAHEVDEWIATHLLSVIGDGWHPAGLIMLLTGFVFACRLLMPWIPATLLLSLALVPAAPRLGLNPWVVGFVVLVAANAWIHPSLSDYCRVTRDAAGEDLFGQRQAMLAGIVLSVLTVIGLAVSIPYWHMLGILSP
jgi:divalent anion:Na+ symporter, DASS family